MTACGCGGLSCARCPGPELAGLVSDEDWKRLHRAMWCLLHPIACKDNPITKPIHQANALLWVALFVVVVWKTGD